MQEMKLTENTLTVLNGKHALVIGGSVAGMFAARVLSEHFEQVTIVERDPAPPSFLPQYWGGKKGGAARKGVPQGNHLHLLLRSGGIIIEQLFPSLTQELQASGTTLVDFAADTCWFHRDQWKLRYDSNFPVLVQSRPFLEWHIRRRLASYANVTFRYATSVTNLCANAEHSRVTGIQIQAQEELEELSADLVVDASGRGSKTPRWLSALNYAPPRRIQGQDSLGLLKQILPARQARVVGFDVLPQRATTN